MDDVESLGALAEPVRRALYRWVVAQAEAVSRDQAAAGAGVPRHTAKFHLDKLVADGLLETEFRRLTGRRGPGAGRPAKLYRRSPRQVTVTLPPRRYELAAQIMATALDHGGGPEALAAASAEVGRRAWAGSVGASLEALGYEPRERDGVVELVNCPFHTLAAGAHRVGLRHEPAPRRRAARRHRPPRRARSRPGAVRAGDRRFRMSGPAPSGSR